MTIPPHLAGIPVLVGLLIEHRPVRTRTIGEFSCRACPDMRFPDYDLFAAHQAQQIFGRLEVTDPAIAPENPTEPEECCPHSEIRLEDRQHLNDQHEAFLYRCVECELSKLIARFIGEVPTDAEVRKAFEGER